MSEAPDYEPMPTPAVVEVADVKLRMGIPPADTTEDVALSSIVDAVDVVVRGLPIADKARGLDTWPVDIVLGAGMLAARLHRRKDTPDGVATFGDQGPVYIQRNDPDIAMVLRLGDWSVPAVG